MCVCVLKGHGVCALSEPLARTRKGSGSGCGTTSNWLLRGSKEMEGREGDGFNYATVFCRCHVLFLATVTANITLTHATHKEGTDCEQTQLLICMFMGSSMEQQERKQQHEAPHEHILKY